MYSRRTATLRRTRGTTGANCACSRTRNSSSPTAPSSAQWLPPSASPPRSSTRARRFHRGWPPILLDRQGERRRLHAASTERSVPGLSSRATCSSTRCKSPEGDHPVSAACAPRCLVARAPALIDRHGEPANCAGRSQATWWRSVPCTIQRAVMGLDSCCDCAPTTYALRPGGRAIMADVSCRSHTRWLCVCTFALATLWPRRPAGPAHRRSAAQSQQRVTSDKTQQSVNIDNTGARWSLLLQYKLYLIAYTVQLYV